LKPLVQKSPNEVLVVCTRRIGDVLLSTALVRSLRRAWPEAAIDMLVFRGTESIVEANPDLRRVVTVGERDSLGQRLGAFRTLWKRYDLACSTQASDRATFYAAAAGRTAVGLLDPAKAPAWKRALLHRWVPFDDLNVHTVMAGLALCPVLGIATVPEVVVSWRASDEADVARAVPFDAQATAYAVLHVSPKFAYKMWTVEGWVALARWLTERGVRPVILAGTDPEDTAYASKISTDVPGALNLAGILRLPAVGALLDRARIFVGTDTAVTHMAAALGVPTIALFGPSNPVKWGPWPRDFAGPDSPWRMVGSERSGNVALIQGQTTCVPCREEGCERHVRSLSNCLQHLPAGRVIEAARGMLAAASR
jgi:heptosyltransferase III